MKANLTAVCSSKTQEEIRSFLTGYLEGLNLSDIEINQIVLAVDETVANAILHGNQSDSLKSIEIDIDITQKRIRIEISDIGLFDVKENEKKEKDIKQVIQEKQRGGLGLKLVYAIMDVVCFYTRDRKSYCLLVKIFNKEKS